MVASVLEKRSLQDKGENLLKRNVSTERKPYILLVKRRNYHI